jgi:hypothetical protein
MQGIEDKGGPVMFSKTAIALAAASIAVGAFAIAPAMANYAPCVENTSTKGCPGYINSTTQNSYKGAEHHTRYMTRHHG